jgi:hypothetical protein
MRILAWLILLCVAMTKAMPSGPRTALNSQQTAQTEEKKKTEMTTDIPRYKFVGV